DVRGEEVGDTIAVGDPQRYVVEGIRLHRLEHSDGGGADRPPPGFVLLTTVDGALELGLVHLRPARDVHPLRLVLELLLGAALRAIRARALTPAAARRRISPGRARRGLRLTAPRTLLVDGAGSDLLRALDRRAALLLAVLDVFVLTL